MGIVFKNVCMKKISLLLWVLCTSVTLFAQKSTTVKGFVKHKRTPEITLFEIENGDMIAPIVLHLFRKRQVSMRWEIAE